MRRRISSLRRILFIKRGNPSSKCFSKPKARRQVAPCFVLGNPSYNDLAGRNGSGLCGDATMPRDSLVF